MKQQSITARLGVPVACAFLTVSPYAKAVTILDTFSPVPICCAPAIGQNLDVTQKVGVSFTVASQFQITDFLIALQGNGTFRAGVQGSATTAQGLVPTSTFLFSMAFLDPVQPLSVSGLDWILNPGTYFFVAEGESFPSRGAWTRGIGASTAVSINNSAWFLVGDGPGAIRVTALPVPEPTSLVMFACGLLMLSRFKRKGASEA